MAHKASTNKAGAQAGRQCSFNGSEHFKPLKYQIKYLSNACCDCWGELNSLLLTTLF